jgi:hypothetical protein
MKLLTTIRTIRKLVARRLLMKRYLDVEGNYICDDCGLSCGDWFATKEAWAEAGLGQLDNVCTFCFERRLARPLVFDDFFLSKAKRAQLVSLSHPQRAQFEQCFVAVLRGGK